MRHDWAGGTNLVLTRATSFMANEANKLTAAARHSQFFFVYTLSL